MEIRDGREGRETEVETRKREKRETGETEHRDGIREYIVALISIGILGCKSNFIAMNGIEKWGALTMVRFRIQFVNTI